MRLGRYQLEDELGAGGMATVFRARDAELRREVAVKVLFPHLSRRREVVARFHREARAAAGLEHPHIMRVYDVGGGVTGEAADEHDPPYIVLELVRGHSLRELVEEHGALEAELVACIGAILCDALSAAHGAGIIHRDVKPANVLVAEGGRVVLADFGVARVEDEDSLVTRTGAMLGTPAYMSPEQALGDALDARSDLYSVGATLYQLATGAMPFSGPTPRVIAALSQGELTPPLRVNPAVGPALADVIVRLMAKNPADRFGSAPEAGAALLAVARAGGFDDPDEELAAFFADTPEYRRTARRRALAATVARAREALDARRLPRAMALVDRALALDPHDPEANQLVDRLGGAQSRLRWILVAGVACLIGGGSVAIAMLSHHGSSGVAASRGAQAAAAEAIVVDASASPPPLELAGDAGPLAHTEGASGDSIDAAPVAVDVLRRGTGAPPRVPVARRSAAERGPPDAGVKPADAGVIAQNAPIDAAAPMQFASIELAMDAWCDVSVDGRAHGRARRGQRIELPPGRHEVICSQGPGLAEWQTTVDLRPGQHRTLEGRLLRPVRVTLSLAEGDSIRIGDTHYENGASLELRPARYRVELRSGKRSLRSAWISIPPVPSCTLRDRPSLDCFR